MNAASRGVRNAFRNTIRTFSIVVILGLSVGLTLSMLVARQAVQTKIQSVKSSVGNNISVSPAGARGFQGGGEPLTTDQLAKLKSIPHVIGLSESLQDRLTSDNTNLASAITPGSLGQRQAGNSGVGFQVAPGDAPRVSDNGGTTSPNITRTFTPPVIITGVNDLSKPSAYGADTISYTSGSALDPSKDVNEAVIGKALAEKNNLQTGSTFTVYSQTVKVVGIYDTGNTFSNAGLVMSLPAVQRLSGQTSDITSATVTVDSVDNIDGVVSSVKSSLGSAADVTNDQEQAKQTVQPLENVKSIALFSLIGALVAGALIILLTMLMIVRERRREIGVLKAIGASNLKTMLQFVSEAVTLTVLGMIVGLVIGVAAASPITRVLVNNSSNNNSQTISGPGGIVAVSRGDRGLRGFGNTGLNNVRNIKASVGWSILGYGVASALAIAIIGSAVPSLLISKIRPAEVMRAE